MSSYSDKLNAAIDATKGRTLPGTANALSLAGIVWGIVALGYGLTAGHQGWTLGAWLVAAVYGFGLAQGALVFAGILTATQARWGRPLKRIAEGLALSVPFVYLILVAFLAVGTTVYPWHPHTITGSPVPLAPHSPEALASKELWLDPTFFPIRLCFAVGYLVVMDLIYLRASLGPDLLAARQRLGADGAGWWKLFIGGETDLKAFRERADARMYNLVPVLGISYALVMSMVAFDMIMSLDPWWVSNMFGGWIFMSSIWLALAVVGATAYLSLDWLSLRSWVRPKTMHDLGRFTLAGCMFWAYTLYAQILPIWYTNVPEETNFLMVRMMLPQWSPMSKVVAVMCFIGPFTMLLSRGLKKMRGPYIAVAAVIMTGLFLERSLLVMPSVWLEATVPWGMFAFVNVGLLALVLGLITQISGRALASMPAVPVTDPMLEEHPWDVHIHGLDHAHGHH